MNIDSGRDTFGAGALNRRVMLLAGTAAQEATFGGEQVSYAELGPAWAEVTESAGASATGSARMDSHAWPHRIRIRARSGLGLPLRVRLDDGRIVQVEGIARLGRRYVVLAGMELGHLQP